MKNNPNDNSSLDQATDQIPMKGNAQMNILNVQQASKFLGKTAAALRNGYKRWGIPHFRLGGQIKFTQEALQEWVEKNMIHDAEQLAAMTPPPSADGRRRGRKPGSGKKS